MIRVQRNTMPVFSDEGPSIRGGSVVAVGDRQRQQRLLGFLRVRIKGVRAFL